jgi:hypothetical protein
MKIRNLDLTENVINAEHEALGLPPVEDEVSHPSNHPVLRIAVFAVVFLLIATLAYLASRLFNGHHSASGMELISQTVTGDAFWKAVAVGLLAQTVDGALGMAYGITSTTFLLMSGASPAVASASVHIAEVFTTGISGISHVKLGNVNKNLFLRLLIPGMIGAVTGAVVVSKIDGSVLKPFVAGYLFLMGLYIISKVFKKIRTNKEEPRHVAKLGLLGGFVDRPRLRPLHHAPEHPVQLAEARRRARHPGRAGRVEMHASRPAATASATSPPTTSPASRPTRSSIRARSPRSCASGRTFHPEFAYLPRKFKIASTAPWRPRRDPAARHRPAAGAQRRGEVGFRVIVGGGMGRTPIIGHVIREFLPWQHMLTYSRRSCASTTATAAATTCTRRASRSW